MRQIPQEIINTMGNMPKSPEILMGVRDNRAEESIKAHLLVRATDVDGQTYFRRSKPQSSSGCRVENGENPSTHRSLDVRGEKSMKPSRGNFCIAGGSSEALNEPGTCFPCGPGHASRRR